MYNILGYLRRKPKFKEKTSILQDLFNSFDYSYFFGKEYLK